MWAGALAASVAAVGRCPHHGAAPLGPHHRRNCSLTPGRLGVVNGELVTDPSEFPFIAAQGDGNNYNSPFCGGTLVHPEWVLTAAHCLYGNPQSPNYSPPDGQRNVRVQLRILDVDAAPNDVVRRGLAAPYAVPHPDYSASCLTSDIALVRLDAPVHDITPVTLGSSRDATGGEDATLAGWGSIDVACREYDTKLRKGEMHVGTESQCDRALGGYYYHHREVCAGEQLNGRNWVEAGCGDSGGPLFVSSGGGYTQVGVVSWGYGHSYNAYGRVSYFADWIHGIIAQYSAANSTA